MAKTSIIIREDDVCYFTKPQILELIYKPLLEIGLPISLAVIPAVNCRLNEPFVDPSYRGRDLYPDVGQNKDLIEFIKQHNFEVLQHGLTHGVFQREPTFVPEFRIADRKELYRRAIQGQKILEEVFGKKPRFFVPPWDLLSKQAYGVLMRLFDGVSLATLSHGRFKRQSLKLIQEYIPRNIPLHFLPKFLGSRIRRQNYCIINNFLVLEHKGFCIVPGFDKELLFNAINKFNYVTIVVHHWLLVSNVEILKYWHKILNSLLTDNKTCIITLLDVYKVITSRKV